MHEMTKRTAIPQRVKKQVWDRDGHCCILCGNPQANPEAHIVPRSKGGLGDDPRNIVTLCRKCHEELDGDKREILMPIVKDYISGWYFNWSEEQVTYDKYAWLKEVGNENSR